MAVSTLLRVDMNTFDPPGAEAFYCDYLGFERADVDGDAVTLRLGAQWIGLRRAAGAPYPSDCSAADPWFQHIAIVVRDISDAYAHLCGAAAIVPISLGGPQRLPQSSGSVVAFKFRDPDGHPLELIEFPKSVARWRHAPGLFVGIDHSAIVVSDTAASVTFYTGTLGLRQSAQSVNMGGEQERLDGLPGVMVDVVALEPPGSPTPHIELLRYREPPTPRREAVAPGDVAATRMVLRGDSPPPALLTDPDGHHLTILAAPP